MFSKKLLSFQILREFSGVTKYQLEKELGIHHATLLRLERGYYPVSERILLKLQDFYGIKCGKLLYLLDQLALEGVRLRPSDILLPLPDSLQSEFYEKHKLFKK